MFCKNCGGEIPPNELICPFCRSKVDTSKKLVLSVERPWLLLLSALSATCCCMPTGIAAIYYTIRGDSLTNQGKIVEANRAYQIATLTGIVGVALGIVVYIAYFLLIVISEIAKEN